MPGHHMTVTRHEGGPPPSTESASTVTRRQGIAGPYLRYINILPDSGVWLGSILVLLSCPQPEGGDVTQLPAGTQAPAVSLSLRGEPAASPAPDLLDWVESWQFWRFDLEFPLGPQEQCFTYSVSHAHGTTAEFTVHLPAAQRPMHWAYYSCNGMSADVKPDALERQDVTYLWRDMLALHGAYPLHVVFGGGDQVYSDRVWACSALQAWARLSTRYVVRWRVWGGEEREAEGAWLRGRSPCLVGGLVASASMRDSQAQGRQRAPCCLPCAKSGANPILLIVPPANNRNPQ